MTIKKTKKVDFESMTIKELVEFYNARTLKNPVKKFSDRATAIRRCEELLAENPAKDCTPDDLCGMCDDAASPEQPQNENPAGKPLDFKSLTVKEKCILTLLMSETTNIDGTVKGLVVKKEVLLTKTGFAAKVADEIITRLIRGGFVTVVNHQYTEISIVHDARVWIFNKENQIAPDAAGDLAKKDWHCPGPRSNFSGKRIYRVLKENPRREGTLGWHSWNCIKEDGMSFEEYKAAGGRAVDLKWDRDRGRVEVK